MFNIKTVKAQLADRVVSYTALGLTDLRINANSLVAFFSETVITFHELHADGTLNANARVMALGVGDTYILPDGGLVNNANGRKVYVLSGNSRSIGSRELFGKLVCPNTLNNLTALDIVAEVKTTTGVVGTVEVVFSLNKATRVNVLAKANAENARHIALLLDGGVAM